MPVAPLLRPQLPALPKFILSEVEGLG